MKQLVLYFMFFVASSLILIQCARFFPSSVNPGKESPFDNKKINTVKNKEKEKQALSDKKSATKGSMTYISYLPYHILEKISKSNLRTPPYDIVQQYNLTSINIMQER